MILSGKKIEEEVGLGTLIIEPFNKEQLNPNSYNLKLANKMLVYTSYPLDMKSKPEYEELEIPKDGLVLQPGMLYLGRTEEYTETTKYVPMIEGRSSIGRLGMFIHITAGFGDIGFKGYWTLEISVLHPLRVYAGVEVCQIFYHTIDGDYEKYVSGKYQNNKGIQPSLLYKELG